MPLRHVKGEKASFPVDVRHSGGGGGLGTPHMKGVGMLVGNFELNA